MVATTPQTTSVPGMGGLAGRGEPRRERRAEVTQGARNGPS